MTETWSEFVKRVTRDMTQTQAAYMAGVTQTAIGRWVRGDTEAPRAESVVAFARALGAQPVQALVAAGYITVDEAAATIESRQTIRDFGTDELLEELRRRTVQGA